MNFPHRERVTLRPLVRDDVDHILTWVNDREIVGNIAAFSGAPLTREQELAYIDRTLASVDDRVFSVEEAGTGRYLGQVGLHQIYRRSGVARCACIIAAKSDMGSGFGSAALARLLDVAFDDDGLLEKPWM